MQESAELVGIISGIRGLTVLSLAVLFFVFYKRYRHSYLKQWTLGWLALAIHDAARSFSSGVAPWDSGTAQSVAELVGAAAGYLHVGWMLFGAFELIGRTHVKLRAGRFFLGGLALGGAGLASVRTESPAMESFLHSGLYQLFAAGAFLLACGFIWRAQRLRRGFGYRLLAVAFFLYSLGSVFIFAEDLSTQPLASRTAVVSLSFFYLLVVGFGMIATLLEDERKASDLAMTEIEQLAYHDMLTGLPNRPFFMDRLIIASGLADREGTKIGVLLVDLDRFKDINDSLGHYIGDAVLKVVAERLAAVTRKMGNEAVIARFGADEFAVMLCQVRYPEDVSSFADRLLESLKSPVEVQQMELYVTGSIGLSIYPDDAEGAEILVRNADTALYRAKDQGRDRHSVYALSMSQLAKKRLELENMLRKAMQNDEFILHYQPLIDLATNKPFGVEALIRWSHPSLGIIPPDDFIPLAEETGLIVQIGEWVLETACREIAKIQKVMGPEFSVSVNLSARQFYQQDLPNKVARMIHMCEIYPSSLVLEITESDAMRNAETTIETMNRLKRVGIKLAVDDFGTGYSSLDYLKRFPIDALKLDRTFVKDVDSDNEDAAIATAVIAMAHSLGLKVVAEGVENSAQLGFLRQQHCDHIQGHLYSKALSFPDLRSYLANGKTEEPDEPLPS